MLVMEGKWNQNKYTIIEKIGEGAFGKLFKGKNARGDTIAIKISSNTSSIAREYYIMYKLNC